MKTRCPACQTVFRVAPEQLKIRSGKVRCGECHEVFNALDHLLDEDNQRLTPIDPSQTQAAEVDALHSLPEVERQTAALEEAAIGRDQLDISSEISVAEPESNRGLESVQNEVTDEEVRRADEPEDAERSELTHGADLILPRETTQIPGYSKWAEGGMSPPVMSADARMPRWPFVVAAVLLLLLLAGQMTFFYRSEIATVAPSFRPALETFSGFFDVGVPLPRHVELVSIESSDLQSDPAHGNLLVLNATLRNRANYPQDFPALELSLTDTRDAAIAKRVFLPTDYLSDEARAKPFVANGDIAVRLWIEAKEISAAGYRLYVFYP